MAVARMLKVTAIAHQSVVVELVERLRRSEVLDIASSEHELPAHDTLDLQERARLLDEQIAKSQFVAEFLRRFHTIDAPFSSFISEKFHLSEDDFYALVPGDDFEDFYQQCVHLSDRLANIDRHDERLRKLVAELLPWEPLRLQIGQWRGTQHVALFTGTVPASESEAIRQQLRDDVSDVSVEEVGAVGSRMAWVVMAHSGSLEVVRATLNLTNFAEVEFPDLHDYPAEEIEIAEDEIEALASEKSKLLERAEGLSAEHYAHFVALSEALVSERHLVGMHERFGATERTIVVSGWVADSHRQELEDVSASLGGYVDLTLEAPAAEDDPPVMLDNPKWLRPFEVLTDLYGLPKYREVDPTPLMALFFWVFFGMALADVGYGVALMIGALLIKKRLDVGAGVKKFMDLLVYGGAASILIGIITGSYFSMSADLLPAALTRPPLKLFDPLEDIMVFLVISVALGVIHILVGIITRTALDIRDGDWRTAVAEQISTLIFLAAVAIAVIVPGATGPALVLGLAAALVLKGRVLEVPGSTEAPAWDNALGWLWIAAFAAWAVSAAFGGPAITGQAFLAVTVVGVVATKTARRAFLKLLAGAYETYGLSSLISDFLSYTRLAALGLAGMLVGQVANQLGSIIVQLMGPAAGIVFAVLVVIVLHTINLVINLLGAFVHPTRLQFVEFFSKFYEGGGRPYRPLGPKTKSLVLHPDAGSQEGGRRK